MLDIALPFVEQLDLLRIDIDADNFCARPRKLQRKRQSDVTQTYDGDFHFDKKQKLRKQKAQISAFPVSTFKLLTVLLSALCFPNFSFQPFPLVLLIIVV